MCEYGGNIYKSGDSFPGTGDNWFNTCFCPENGYVHCTEIACNKENMVNVNQ